MLYMVEMQINIPADIDPAHVERLKAEEKARSAELQADGRWRNLWRVVGQYANVSIFNVDSHAELHELLSTLPLFPFMTMKVTPLCRHASSIREGDD